MFMLRLSRRLPCVLVIAALCGAAAAQPGAFVGPAEVTGQDVYVRSGPNTNHYPVLKLSRPARVTVVGWNGQWARIEPPAGAFSLISKLFVAAEGDGHTVTGNNVNVRAGSALHPTRSDRAQGQLNRGDKVTVVGETTEYYKIVPPAGVVLYMHGKYLKAAPVGVTPAPATRPAAPRPVATRPATTRPATTRPATTQPATTQPVVLTAQDAQQRLAALLAAEDALKAQFAKPDTARPDLERLLATYKAIGAPADDPLTPHVQYRLKFLEALIQRIDGLKEVSQRAEELRAAQRLLAAEGDRIRLSGIVVPRGESFTMEGRLSASRLFPGTAGRPRRWVVRADDEARTILGFVQAGVGQKDDLDGAIGWKVILTGVKRYSGDVRQTVLEVTSVQKLPGGEPIRPAPLPAPTPLRPKPAPATQPATQPATAAPAEPRPTGLPMAETDALGALPVDPAEYK